MIIKTGVKCFLLSYIYQLYSGWPDTAKKSSFYKMIRNLINLIVFGLFILCSSTLLSQKLPRDQWGAPAVKVSHYDGKWIITGKKQKVTLNESDLAIKVEAGQVVWNMAPSEENDILVKSKGESALIVIVETPDDAAYKFSHPAGGPTVICPRWLASLGKFQNKRIIDGNTNLILLTLLT